VKTRRYFRAALKQLLTKTQRDSLKKEAAISVMTLKEDRDELQGKEGSIDMRDSQVVIEMSATTRSLCRGSA